MKVSAFVPIKKFSNSKERLSNVLDSINRSKLAEQMAKHTIKTLFNSNICDSITIVTNDKDLTFINTVSYFTELPLNQALHEAIASKPNNGITLVMHADLPRINEKDLQKFKEAFTKTKISIISDLHKNGTNCLMFDSSMDFNLKFGEDSYALFIKEFESNELIYQDICLPSLQDDLDSEEDYFKLNQYING
jgi:2-phospho-L-lactate guanylyltransferase